MPVSADTLALLMAAGVNGDALLDVVRSIDADATVGKPARTARQERNRRYYERKRLNKTSEQDVLAPPIEDHTPQPSLRSGNSKTRASRLADEWNPAPTDVEFAQTTGLTDSQIRTEAAKFRDYWHAKPGAAATKLDWPATWRTWCRNAAERASPPGGNRPRAGPLPTSRRASVTSEVNELLEEMGHGHH